MGRLRRPTVIVVSELNSISAQGRCRAIVSRAPVSTSCSWPSTSILTKSSRSSAVALAHPSSVTTSTSTVPSASVGVMCECGPASSNPDPTQLAADGGLDRRAVVDRVDSEGLREVRKVRRLRLERPHMTVRREVAHQQRGEAKIGADVDAPNPAERPAGTARGLWDRRRRRPAPRSGSSHRRLSRTPGATRH